MQFAAKPHTGTVEPARYQALDRVGIGTHPRIRHALCTRSHKISPRVPLQTPLTHYKSINTGMQCINVGE